MRVHSALLLSPWLLLSASAQVDLEANVCVPLKGVGRCTSTLVEPYGSRPKYCVVNGKSTVCGVEILKSDINVCTRVRQAMPGGAGDAFLNDALTLCDCVPAAKRMAASTQFNAVMTYGPIARDAVGPAFAAKSVDMCIVNGKLSIEDDRQSSVLSVLSGTDGWSGTQGGDISTDEYHKLLVAVSPCYTSSGCEANKIRDWYTAYYARSPGLTDGHVNLMLNDWLKLYTTLTSRISDVAKASKAVQDTLKKVSNDVTATRNAVCTGTNCNGSTAKAWLAKISQTLTTVKSAEAASSGSSSAISAIAKLRSSTQTGISAVSDVPVGSYLNGLYSGNFITQMSEVIQGFGGVWYLPILASNLKKDVVPVILLTKHVTKVQTAQSQLKSVLEPDWMKQTHLFTTASSRRVRDGFIKIQGHMKTLSTPLATLATAIKRLDDTLNQFPLRKQNLEIQTGAVTYKRWNSNSYQAPCASKTTKSYTHSGYSATIEYIKIEQCQFGPEWYYLPSYHVPYMKWRFV